MAKCVFTNFEAAETRIPWELHVAYNGYHYLHLTGTLLNPSRWLESYITEVQETLHAPWAWIDTFESFVLASEQNWPQPVKASDRIWLAGLAQHRRRVARQSYNSYEAQTRTAVAFVLRSGQRTVTFRDKPAYYVHSCFHFLPKSHYELYSGIVQVGKATSPVKQSLAAHGLSVDEEFYLE